MASHIVGYPRMGPKRELKFALESFWDGKSSADDLQKVASDIRSSIWKQMKDAGIKYIPSNTFSFYDQVLDTTCHGNDQMVRHKFLGVDTVLLLLALLATYCYLNLQKASHYRIERSRCNMDPTKLTGRVITSVTWPNSNHLKIVWRLKISHSKLMRQPELATAQRALRSQRIRQKGDTGNEHVVSRSHGFRALPLNRKVCILTTLKSFKNFNIFTIKVNYILGP
ncbi:hypothetical protein LXL04_032887 [Taraxacum kok-saghyz]